MSYEWSNLCARKITLCAVTFIVFLITNYIKTVAPNPIDITSSANPNELKKLKIHVCSDKLVDRMSFICGDKGFFSPMELFNDQEDDIYARGPGIVNECCANPCTWEDLEAYCNSVSTFFSGENNSDYGSDSKYFVNVSFISFLF